MSEPRPRKKGEVVPNRGKVSPAETYVRNLPGKNYLLSEVAKMVDMDSHTIRRLIKADPQRVNAPSLIGRMGNQEIYVFTEDDVEEIRAYYERRYSVINKPGRKDK